MVPEEMRGVWRRRSIAVDGGAPGEPAEVLWLQAAEAFADLRVPHEGSGGIEAFAGTTHWDAPRLTWQHTIDWNGGFAGYDCGDIEWRAGALVERGTFDEGGRAREYEEVWDRIDPGDSFTACTSERAIVVQVGAHSLALRDGRPDGATFDVRAAYRTRAQEWQDVYVFGAGAELPLAMVAAELPEWRVTESTPASAPR